LTTFIELSDMEKMVLVDTLQFRIHVIEVTSERKKSIA